MLTNAENLFNTALEYIQAYTDSLNDDTCSLKEQKTLKKHMFNSLAVLPDDTLKYLVETSKNKTKFGDIFPLTSLAAVKAYQAVIWPDPQNETDAVEGKNLMKACLAVENYMKISSEHLHNIETSTPEALKKVQDANNIMHATLSVLPDEKIKEIAASYQYMHQGNVLKPPIIIDKIKGYRPKEPSSSAAEGKTEDQPESPEPPPMVDIDYLPTNILNEEPLMQNEIFPPSPIESPAIAATPFPQTLIKEAEKASLKEPKEIMDAIAAIDEYSQTLAKGTPTSFLAEKKLSQRAMLEALAVLPDHILEYTLEKYKMTTPFGNRVPAASLSDVQSFRRDEKAKNEPQTEPQEEAQPDPVSPSTDDKPKPTNFEELENLWRWLGVSQKDEEGFLTFPKNKAAKGLRVSSDRICFGDEKTAAIDPHVLRFTMLHAQKFWNGRLNVEGTPEHKMRITAYAELFNLKVCNYNPTREERVEIDRLKKQIPITANNNDDAAIPKKRGGFQNMKKRVATTLKLAI